MRLKTTTRLNRERGQAIAFFAVLMPVLAIFAIEILEYMITTARVMETIAAADLAAHAGAQEIIVWDDGTLTSTGHGVSVATTYFINQVPAHSRFVSANCGIHQGRPACWVTAEVEPPAYLLWTPREWITVNAVGYLANGITRGDQ